MMEPRQSESLWKGILSVLYLLPSSSDISLATDQQDEATLGQRDELLLFCNRNPWYAS